MKQVLITLDDTGLHIESKVDDLIELMGMIECAKNQVFSMIADQITATGEIVNNEAEVQA